MEYIKLGNTDITISKLCVGCMSFGKAGAMHDWTLDEKLGRNVCISSGCGCNKAESAAGCNAVG